MGKNKRQRLAPSTKRSTPSHKHVLAKQHTKKSQTSTKAAAKQIHKQNFHEKPVIPFAKHDRILLIGEGDLSFAASLVGHHGCQHVTATVLEKDLAALQEKYEGVKERVDVIQGVRREVGDDLLGAADDDNDDGGGEGFRGFSDTGSEADDAKTIEASLETESHEELPTLNDEANGIDQVRQRSTVKFNVDAASMGPYLDAEARRAGRGKIGGMDRIIFNFPHVGGKSTDVNRQVRYNQELLVSFFKRALLSLAPHGSMIVTLFECEPYTLWNIRDLGRHAGLQVERSFKFQAAAYPGYHHARTVGTIRSKSGDLGGGWKGEDRPARSFIFVRKTDMPAILQPAKRKQREDSSDDDGDDV